MNASGSAANLVQSVKNLMNEWEVTKSYWHDIKSQEFERHYLEPLPSHVAGAITVMEEIDQLLKKIRSDCE
jgi:predicted house-cleaning NTP pyrophosphatase (Maf/HAM1 superfamily)